MVCTPPVPAVVVWMVVQVLPSVEVCRVKARP
jgi:hypothetical protein